MNPEFSTPSTPKLTLTRTVLTMLMLAGLMTQGCASHTEWKVDAVEPSRKGATVRSVSIAPFTGEGRQNGTEFARILAGYLEGQNFISVQEQGAEGFINGSLNGTGANIETWRSEYKSDGKTRYTYHAKLTKSLTASYTLTTKDRTWSGTYHDEHIEEARSSDGYGAAKSELRSNKTVAGWLMHGLATKIGQDLTPFRSKKTYKLKLGDSDNLELGADYAKLGREEQAMSIFRQVAERTSNDEDRAAALYNIGVLHETRGDFNKAFESYRDASQFHLEELMYPEAITRLEQEIDKRAIVDKQIQALSR